MVKENPSELCRSLCIIRALPAFKCCNNVAANIESFQGMVILPCLYNSMQLCRRVGTIIIAKEFDGVNVPVSCPNCQDIAHHLKLMSLVELYDMVHQVLVSSDNGHPHQS